MKKILSLLLMIILFKTSYCQVISGIIKDKDNNDAVMFALIYFSGTTVGTESDEKGYFELRVPEDISLPLTISALGYYSETISDYSSGKELQIYLTPKVFEIGEITVDGRAQAKERKANFRLFRNAFLGTTSNSRSCIILNEYDISFTTDQNGDTLKAFALEPILIENKSLGYTITFYLDRFELNLKDYSCFFAGSIIFSEDPSIREHQKRVIERRRDKTYLGSRMHFIRALWNNNLDHSGYVIRDTQGKYLKYSDLVLQADTSDTDNQFKYMRNTGTLHLTYAPTGEKSDVIILKNNFGFSKDGYFDPLGLTWGGDMALQRIADWLPYEYPSE